MRKWSKKTEIENIERRYKDKIERESSQKVEMKVEWDSGDIVEGESGMRK